MVSPPPAIPTAGPEDLAAMIFAMAMLPFAYFGNSISPIGPFQTIVLAFLINSANFSIVAGPISNICSSEAQIILFLAIFTILNFVLVLISATTTSIGKIILAIFVNDFALTISCLSYSD